MTYAEYVKALSDVMSDEPARVREGNEALFNAAVKGDDRKKNPQLALVDAEK